MSESADSSAAGAVETAGPLEGGPAASAPTAPEKLPSSIRTLIFIRDRGIIILWIALILLFSIWAHPYFLSVGNAMLILNAGAISAIFAAAIAMGVFSGALDLSVPGVAAFVGMVVAWLITRGYPVGIALIAGVAIGLVIGIINARITLLGLNPLVVTIGTLTILTGLAAVVGGGYTIPGLDALAFLGTDTYFAIASSWTVAVDPVFLLPSFSFVVGGFDGVPGPVFIMGVAFVVMTIFFTKTRGGIRVMAVGGNAEAVRRVGLSSDFYRTLGFMLSAMLAAIGGIVTAAYVGEANPQASPGIIFDGLTAVALAGVSLAGGRGSLPRVLVGALILATISDGLTIAGADPYWATVTTGVLLIGALVLDLVLTKAVSRRLVSVGNLSVHGKKA
jgi:ribose transport system permease protein